MNRKTMWLVSAIALSVCTSQAQTLSPDPETQRYLEAMVTKIGESLIYPSSAPRRQVQCEVAFTVSPDGRILNPQLSMPTDDPAINTECVDVFGRIGSFPPLPASTPSRNEGLKLAIPLSFQPPPAPERSKTQAYLESIQKLTLDALVYPPGVPMKQGSCVVKVNVARDGSVLATELTRSAEDRDLDEECLAVFRRVGRFPPFPDDAPPELKQFDFSMPINFVLE